jgi:hypothetical protein
MEVLIIFKKQFEKNPEEKFFQNLKNHPAK